MTSGGILGTSGGVEWRPWLLIAATALVVLAVNASSDYIDMRRAGAAFRWWEPLAWEATSAMIVVGLAPLIGGAVRRWPPQRTALLQTLLIHLALTLPFAAVHVAGLYGLRSAIYALADLRYGYFDDGLAVVGFYEWRKDVLSYALIAAIYWLSAALAQRQPAAAGPDARIEVRDGAALLFLAPAEISHVEAAGNYVEIHTASKVHLVRGTLAAWDVRLAGQGIARVHRSRLVQRARIAALRPTPSGDVEISLMDGRVLLGSRRYRANLDRERLNSMPRHGPDSTQDQSGKPT